MQTKAIVVLWRLALTADGRAVLLEANAVAAVMELAETYCDDAGTAVALVLLVGEWVGGKR